MLGFSLAGVIGACQEDPRVHACLAHTNQHDDCGIACLAHESEESCEKWEQMTSELCERVGKHMCERICEGDRNPYACQKAASM